MTTTTNDAGRLQAMLATLPAADLRGVEARAQAVLDSHTPPTTAAREAAIATVRACRVERDRRCEAGRKLAAEYRAKSS